MILALLAMDVIKVVTTFSGGIVAVNFVRILLSMFLKKLDVSW